jgi:cytochrome c oxidase assembly protein subunit 15
MAVADSAAPRSAALARLCFALNGVILALIVLGALVRAHGAGLACPDWPLCFGELVPRFDVKVAFEWTHRLLAGTLGLAYLALGAAILRDPAARAAAGRSWWLGLALLGVQVLLGALTVWHLLASWTVTSHLLTGNAWNAAVLWVGLSLAARGAHAGWAETPHRARIALVLSALFLVFQVAIGGLVSSRYAGLACPDWPSCYEGEWFPIWGFASPVGVQIHHRANGYLLAAFLAWLAFEARGVPRLARRARLALALVLVQIGVGVANVLLELPVEVTALHSALAAALVLTVTAAAHTAFAKEPR